jgi:hypothetical protein
MPKWLKTLVALLLLPACFGAATALWRVLQASGPAENVWVLLLTGAACWLVIFWLLPKPMLAYVYAHELTHVLWTWLCGGKVSRFKASAKGGQVVVSKTNFAIVLAPYFFPFYVVVVVGLFGLGNLVWDWRPYLMGFHLLVGVAYAFHLTLTWHILETDQSDISSQGYLFSAVVIFLGNITVLLLGLPLLTGQVGVGTTLGWWLAGSMAVVQRVGGLF